MKIEQLFEYQKLASLLSIRAAKEMANDDHSDDVFDKWEAKGDYAHSLNDRAREMFDSWCKDNLDRGHRSRRLLAKGKKYLELQIAFADDYIREMYMAMPRDVIQ